MVKRATVVMIAAALIIVVGCALPLKMDAPPTVDLSHLTVHPYTAGLYIPAETAEYKYTVATSPVDKMVYPLGEQTAQIFQQCTSGAFAKVVRVDSLNPSEPVDVIIQPSITRFKAIIPMPAYNPYEATMVYHVDVFDASGNKIFAQTATGQAQSSAGMTSGFSARSICAQVAQQAMTDAVKQIMEGMAEAEELAQIK